MVDAETQIRIWFIFGFASNKTFKIFHSISKANVKIYTQRSFSARYVWS